MWAFLLEMEEGSGRVFGFDDQEERDRFRNNLGSSAHRYGKMHDRKFLVRTLPEKDGQFRCGVWRDFANPDDAPEGWNE